MVDETELIRRMLAGDERAFEAFFDAHFARVYRFALPRLGGDVEATREVVQATLAKAMRQLGGYHGRSALFTWICQICRHEIVDHIRANRRHTENVVRIDDRPGLRAAIEAIEAPAEYDLQESFSRNELLEAVHSILDRLPSRYGDALAWKYMEGHSVEEVGRRLGIGHGAAQSLLARARRAFRDAVEQVLGTAVDDVADGLDR